MKINQTVVRGYSNIILFSLAIWIGNFDAFAISLGDRVQANGTVNVRQTPAGTLLGTQSSGSQGVTIGGPTVATLNGTSYTWWNVNFDSGTDGWVADIGLIAIVPAAPTLNSPGSGSSPGTTISTLTPTMSWNAVNGATDYGLYIYDVTTSTLIYNHDSVGNVTSLVLPSGTLTAGHSYRWNMRSHDSAGFSATYSALLYFQTQSSPAPSISSVSPTSMVADNNLHSFKVYGSNFDMTSSHLLFTDPLGNPYTSASHPAYENRVSASEFDYQIDNAGAAGTWTVKVQNPDGQTSGTVNFTVTNAPPPPSISSVSPTSMLADNNLHSFKVYGSNFDTTSSHLLFTDPLGNPYTSASHPAYENRVSASEFDYQIDNAGAAGTWTVKVQNPDGQTSGTVNFTVTNAPPPPSISSVSPTSMLADNNLHSFKVYGSNFDTTSSHLLFTDPLGNPYTSASHPAYENRVSASEFDYQIDNAGAAGTWTVKVQNPDGQTSGTVNFTVTNAPPPPSISSVSPTSMLADNNLHSFKVYGSNFDMTSSHLLFTDPLGNPYTSASHPAYENRVSASEFDYQIDNAGAAGTWTVKVQNPDGQTSSAVSFTVTNSTTTSGQGADFNVDGSPINWQQETSSSPSFLIIKAAQGRNTHSFLPSNMSSVPTVTNGFTFGVYDYADPDEYANPLTMVTDPSNSGAVIADAQATANAYYQIAKPYLTAGHLQPALDLEDDLNEAGNGLGEGGFNIRSYVTGAPVWTWSQIAEWVAAWTTQLQQDLQHDGGPVVTPILYMNQNYAQNLSPSLINSFLSSPVTFQLWVSDINDSPNIDPNPSIGSWPTWAIEQYDWTGTTPPGDLDALNSSAALTSLEISGGSGGASPPMTSSPKLTGTTFTLSVPTQVGTNYVLEFKNFLSDAVWTPIQTNSGNGTQMTLTNTGVVGPSRFYHIRVQ